MVAVCLLLGGVLSLNDTFCVYGPYLVILVLEILVAAAKLRHGVLFGGRGGLLYGAVAVYKILIAV